MPIVIPAMCRHASQLHASWQSCRFSSHMEKVADMGLPRMVFDKRKLRPAFG